MLYKFVISERQGQKVLNLDPNPEFNVNNYIVQVSEIALRGFGGIPTQTV
jgi:hypothetical protein